MSKYIYIDRIYGSFKLNEYIVKLLKLPEVRRLKYVSLVSVPQEFLNTWGLYFDSRLEHSIGVSYLSNFLKFEKIKELISICGLLHDIGSPPFSHATEKIMAVHLGKDHESMNIDVIKNSEIKDILENLGIFEDCIELLKKLRPESALLFGNIDLDNIDNIARFAYNASLPILFDPIRIVKSFRYNGKYFVTNEEEYKKWRKSRSYVYSIIYASEISIMYSMLIRFIYLLYNRRELPIEFYRFTDFEALNFLKSTFLKERIEEAEKGKIFVPIYFTKIPEELIDLNIIKMQKILDELCEEIKIDYDQICILFEKVKLTNLYIFGIYVHSSLIGSVNLVKKIVSYVKEKIFNKKSQRFSL